MSDLERFHLFLVEHEVPHAVIAGTVRGRGPEEPRPLDLIVGRSSWEAETVRRAEIRDAGGVLLPVVRPSDLVALKLFAGGWKDGQDIAGLLEATLDRQRLVDEVELLLPRLPGEAHKLWQEILPRHT